MAEVLHLNPGRLISQVCREELCLGTDHLVRKDFLEDAPEAVGMLVKGTGKLNPWRKVATATMAVFKALFQLQLALGEYSTWLRQQRKGLANALRDPSLPRCPWP